MSYHRKIEPLCIEFHKIPNVFHNLKNYDSHLIIQEPGKFNLKIVNFIPNIFSKRGALASAMSFIDSFQFRSSSLDSLVENL